MNIRNNTVAAIYFSLVYDSALAHINYPPGASPEKYKCNGGETKRNNTFGCLDEQGDQSGRKYLFIFDAGVIESTPWATVKQNRYFLNRYDLTPAQLDSCGWTVTYP